MSVRISYYYPMPPVIIAKIFPRHYYYFVSFFTRPSQCSKLSYLYYFTMEIIFPFSVSQLQLITVVTFFTQGYESASMSSTCEPCKSRNRHSAQTEEPVQAKVFSGKNHEQLEKVIRCSRSTEISSGMFFIGLF